MGILGGGYMRLSFDGSLAAFDVNTGHHWGKSWCAAVAVVKTSGRHESVFYDILKYLHSQDSEIDMSRGIRSMDMSGNGKVLYVTVPYHIKSDGDKNMHYPVRAALIEIDLTTSKMRVIMKVKKGDQYYPFGNLNTNFSGIDVAFTGAGHGGKGNYG